VFHRTGEVCVARFSDQEAQVLRRCLAELASILSDDLDRTDPAVSRLFPDVYRDDPAEAAEFRRLTEDDLRAGKLDQVSEVLSRLGPGGGDVRLDDEAADAWLRALTDVRLVLGNTLGIRDDLDLESELDEAVLADPISARVGQLSVYAYLSFLQESLVEALTS
jgi:hypothetical protein